VTAHVVAVHSHPTHEFSKTSQTSIQLVTGLGVDGDAHFGATVQHRSRLKKDPTQANLRQVHLLHSELFEELSEKGFTVNAGQLGENITTAGIDLLALPKDTRIYIGDTVIIQVTGLRNPCAQIEGFQTGLLNAVLDRDKQGKLIRKAGIMAIVVNDGLVKPMDPIVVELPPEPHHHLEPV